MGPLDSAPEHHHHEHNEGLFVVFLSFDFHQSAYFSVHYPNPTVMAIYKKHKFLNISRATCD